jgi:hypothetical protein
MKYGYGATQFGPLSRHVLDEELQNIVLVWGHKMALG